MAQRSGRGGERCTMLNRLQEDLWQGHPQSAVHPYRDCAFPGASLVAQWWKNPSAIVGYAGSIPGLGRSRGEGIGHPL